MFDLRLVLYIVGIMVVTLGGTMLLPALVDLVLGNQDWQVFTISATVTVFIGGSLMLTNRTSNGGQWRAREAVLMTNLAWLMLSIFGALPLHLSELDLSYTDAFFEAVSGLTTTGSTVMVGLDDAPPGILLWRSILQWLGGIGIIVMAISVLPMLAIGGMQLFQMEAFESDKVLPRTAQLASSIGLLYIALTLLCIICYGLAGMGTFDAVTHALTTISTGGFATSDNSMGIFDSAIIDAITITFMILGCLPFVLMIVAIRGGWMKLVMDRQVQWFIGILFSAIGTMTLYTWVYVYQDLGKALRYSAFNVTSVMTGTGYASADYGTWGAFPLTVFFFLMFIGGCAGSTTCAIKVFRFQILYAVTKTQLQKLLQPHGVFIPYYNRRPVPEDVPLAVMSFFAMFGLSFGILAIALGLMGLDFLTAISGAATAISNVGPGLGNIIGPAGNFKPLPDAAKWVLSFGMLLGRLELFTVLVLLLPQFWRR